MASKRVAVGRPSDGRGDCWLLLDDKFLWGGFPKASLAESLADRLNAAFDETEADARADEQERIFGELNARQRERDQSCGCIVCQCESEDRCFGCGAKMCGTDDCVFKEPDDPRVVWTTGHPLVTRERERCICELRALLDPEEYRYNAGLEYAIEELSLTREQAAERAGARKRRPA